MIWIGVDREAREYIDFVVGDRSTHTGMILLSKISQQAENLVATDYWKSYKEMTPSGKLIQTKAETYTVESFNGLIRHFLARFRRKSKCYSKNIDMMIYSLKLFMAKRNDLLSIQIY